jgi:hypothetical protein
VTGAAQQPITAPEANGVRFSIFEVRATGTISPTKSKHSMRPIIHNKIVGLFKGPNMYRPRKNAAARRLAATMER